MYPISRRRSSARPGQRMSNTLAIVVAVSLFGIVSAWNARPAAAQSDAAALGSACERGDTSTANQIGSAHPEYLSQESPISMDGQTPLVIAISHGQTKTALVVVQVMRRNGLSLSRKERDGSTPLTRCLRGELIPVVKALLAAHVNVNERGEDGQTLLQECAHYPDPSTIQTAEFLLSHGANVNVTDGHGNTPLHLTCRSRPGNKRMAQLLVRHGASKTIENADGYTPGELARMCGNAVLADYLH